MTDNSYYEQIGKEVRCIDDEIPFEIPATWEWCRFGSITQLLIGKTPVRGESLFWNNGIYPWVSISDMSDYGHIKTTKEKISAYAAKESFNNRISCAGSLLMSFKLTVGKTSILDVDSFHNEAIITITPYIDDSYILRNYLFLVLPLVSNWGNSKDAIKGKTLNSQSLYNLFLPLPPQQEQQRIVKKIEELFKLCK